MGQKKQWYGTKFRGVRYREHPTRKHGILLDRYFAIRYQQEGKRREEGLGWASEKWTAEKAALELAELKNAAKTGKGHDRLSKRRKEKREKEERQKKIALPFKDIFDDMYYPQAKADKGKSSYKREESLFKKWIKPVIGKLPLKEIAPIHIERIKKNMRDKELSERSVQYALAVIRQVFNFSFRNGLWSGDNPVKKVKPPSINNQRTRFLSPDEAKILLDKVKSKSQELYEICILSLHCGLRAGEIFNLRWVDLDIGAGMMAIKDPKDTATLLLILVRLRLERWKTFSIPLMGIKKMKEIEIPDELLPREGAGREELKALYLIDEEYLHTEKLKGNLTRAVNRIEKAQDLYEIGMIYLKYEDNRLISHQGAIAILVYEDRRLNSALMVVLFSTVAKTGNRIQSLILGNPQ